MKQVLSAEYLILLTIDNNGGQLSSKTLLQKRTYFLSVLLDFDMSFKAHFYGPFSPEIESCLTQLKTLGFIEERPIKFGIADTVGFEYRRYDYELTDDGEEIVASLNKTYPREVKRVNAVLDKLKEAGDTGDYVSLSIAAKINHILRMGEREMGFNEIKGAAKKLGWSIGDQEIEKAASFLKNLKLVSVH